MNNDQISLIGKLAKINSNKQMTTLSEELRELYRRSIKYGVRKEFINTARNDFAIFDSIEYEDAFRWAGQKMVALAEIFSDYHDFREWLSSMIGEPI